MCHLETKKKWFSEGEGEFEIAIVESIWIKRIYWDLSLGPKTIHTRHPSPSKQNIPAYSTRFSPLYLLLPHSSSFIFLLHPNYPRVGPNCHSLPPLLPPIPLSPTPSPPPSCPSYPRPAPTSPTPEIHAQQRAAPSHGGAHRRPRLRPPRLLARAWISRRSRVQPRAPALGSAQQRRPRHLRRHGLPRARRRRFGSGDAELQAAAAWASPSTRPSAARCRRFGAPQWRSWLRRPNLPPCTHSSPARGDKAAAGPLAKPRDSGGEGAGVMAVARCNTSGVY
jgi:hypothetical protein